MKAHLLLLVFAVQEMEEISLICKPFNGDQEENEEILSEQLMDQMLNYLADMQMSLQLLSSGTEITSAQTMARKCLVDSLVLKFQFSLLLETGEQEVLMTLKDVVDGTDNEAEKESYEFCRDLKFVNGKFKPISDFIANIKELINSINTSFETPQLIQFAMDWKKSGRATLDRLLLDQRPSRKEDIMEYLSNDDLTDSCKQELDRLVNEYPPGKMRPTFREEWQPPGSPSSGSSREDDGNSNMARLREKLKDFSSTDALKRLEDTDLIFEKFKKNAGPPSHCGVRLGPWLPEEEKLFIETTLQFGIGNWALIKEKLKTARSSQQLKDKWRNVKPMEVKEIAEELDLKCPGLIKHFQCT